MPAALPTWPQPGPRPRVLKITDSAWAAVLPSGPLLVHPTHILALTAALDWVKHRAHPEACL